MHSGWWGLQREANALSDLRHINYSCEIFFCFTRLPIPQCIARNLNAISSIVPTLINNNVIFLYRELFKYVKTYLDDEFPVTIQSRIV